MSAPFSLLIVGGGPAGLSAARAFREAGGEGAVAIVTDEHRVALVAGRLGEEAAAEIAGWLRAGGVMLELGTPVQAIERAGDDLHVIAGGRRSTAPLVVMAAGVAPRAELAGAAGVQLEGRAVPTDAGMRTTVPALLAAGDVCLAFNQSAGRRLRVEHWGDALGQGAVGGRTAAGAEAVWSDVPGFWSTIGTRTLKYAAWGDGYDDCRLERGPGDGFAVWSGRQDRIVGVLAHEDDDAYDRGSKLIAEGAPWA